jgi:hypothetical protein
MKVSRAEAKRQTGDRRDTGAQRVQYEALVEVGAGKTGGFEAESVDVSPDGMRLRTAYLPEMGEKLVCRFDGFGGEIVTDGEVIWQKREGRGGEFGLRFLSMDPRAMQMLQELCKAPEPSSAGEPAPPSGASPGARVRLHIQGLGSPMRARVRDVARGEVLVGSNLEFLRVGRGVELEDVDRGKSRVAHIEAVSVEVDPETSIPQLIVALTYEPLEEEPTTAPFAVREGKRVQKPVAATPTAESTPEPTVVDGEQTPSFGRASVSFDDSVAPGRLAQVPDAPEDDAEGDGRSLRAVPGAAVARMGAIAKKLGPRIAAAGAGARGAFARMFSVLREKRAQQRERSEKRAPKRTTAPPPSGALRSDGRRLFRDAAREEAAPAPEAPKTDKKRAVVGALAGLAVVLAIYFASAQLSERARGGTGASAPASPPAMAATQPAGPSPVATAEVPLFGATPLSTVEPVPVPVEGEAEGAPPADGEGGAVADAKRAMGNLQKEWGVGRVSEPIHMSVKMDGEIDGITGTETATGFTIVVPGRKSTSSASGLARKHKRCEAVNVVNYPDRAEVTIQFKGEVPAFVARAKGKRLEIELAGDTVKGSRPADGGDDYSNAEPDKKPAKKSGEKKKKKKKG